MKVIVSHDVDHLRIEEHFADRYLPGLLLKTMRAFLKQEQGLLAKRFNRKLENIKRLRDYNDKQGIPETYFFATRKGLSLSYDYQDAAPHIAWLLKQGIEVGLHGQSPNSLEGLMQEKGLLESIHPGKINGIRNHYLRKTDETLEIMSNCGFEYDSTYSGILQPFKHKHLWEIPISVMDVNVLSSIKNDPEKVWHLTLEKIKQAEQIQLPYFVVNFHDVYFSEGWKAYQDWYIKITQYFKERQYCFINFSQAVEELNFAKLPK